MAQIAASEANAAIVERWRTIAFKALFQPMIAKKVSVFEIIAI